MPIPSSDGQSAKLYTLRAISAELEQKISKDPPNSYLKVIVPKSSHFTSEIKGTYRPVWDCYLSLGLHVPSTNIVLQIESRTNLGNSKIIGKTEISLESLLTICRYDSVAILELCNSRKRGVRVGTVTVLLTEDQYINTQSSREALTWLQSEVNNTQGIIQARKPRNAPFPSTSADRIFSRIAVLSNVIEHTSKVHPVINIAWSTVSSFHKALQNQSSLHQRITDLIVQMDETLGFVEDVNIASDKSKNFEDTVIEISTVIGDCCQFIQSYIHRGFTERAIKQWFPGELEQVEYFGSRLSQLRNQINGKVLSQILITVAGKRTKGDDPSLLTNLERNTKPPGPTPAFTGRKDILSELSRYFDQTTTPAKCQIQRIFVLWGLGGTGKTQIALKFANDYRSSFSAVYMIDASSTESIQSSLTSIGLSVGIENADAKKTLNWLCSQEREWLLIYDNAGNPKVNLRVFFPQCCHGNILITTRNRECRVHALIANINVSTMDSQEAVELLLRITGKPASDNNISISSTLVHELGYLTLAIVQAGSYVLAGKCSLSRYLEIYKRSRVRLLSQMPTQRMDDYNESVYNTWEISFANVATFTQTIFNVCAFLHRDGISEEIFRRAVFSLSQGTLISTHNPLNSDIPAIDYSSNFLSTLVTESGSFNDVLLGDAISELLSYSLLTERDDGLYSIHPLVQSWARDRLPPAEMKKALGCAVCVLYHSLSYDDTLGPVWLRQIYEKHIREVFRDARTDGIKEKFAQALYTLGFSRDAASLVSDVLQFRRNLLGDNHETTLQTMVTLSMTYRGLGRWNDAKTLALDVLRLRGTALGYGHSDTLDAMADLGSVYSKLGKWTQAVKIEKKVLWYRRQVLGDSHPETLKAMTRLSSTTRALGQYWLSETIDLHVYKTLARSHCRGRIEMLNAMASLAWSYHMLGKYRLAEDLEVQVLDIRRQAIGEQHPETLQAMASLAWTRSGLGRYREAEVLECQVLHARAKLLGKEHPDTLWSMASLACTYNNLGSYRRAEDLQKDVLEAWKRLLGNEHPDTLTAMSNLACTWQYLGNYQRSECLEVRVLEVQSRLLGMEHPDTLKAMAILASTYAYRGNYQKAKVLRVQVLDARKRLLGEDHPDTLKAMGNLTLTYRSLGNYRAAQTLEVQILEARKRLLGDEHPDTLLAVGSLACTYGDLGNYRKAQVLEAHVFGVQKRLLGQEHPETLVSMANLASTYSRLGDNDTAKDLKMQVLEARTRLLGEDHLSTLWTMASLACTHRNLGEYHVAENLEIKVLEARRRLLGEEHPETLRSMGNLARTYSSLGNNQEAEFLKTQVLNARIRLLGEEHPHTLRSKASLACTYDDLGRYEEAQILGAQALDGQERLLGEEHPETLRSMINLTCTYDHLKNYVEVETLKKRVFEIRKRLLGEEPSGTLKSMANLAWSYRNMKNYHCG